ncbi:MAG: ISL3 family transposase [Erysipelotrichaceae bacterium]|nr:ISL3 family transposase [Erysipelotrichaceae bacterium]
MNHGGRCCKCGTFTKKVKEYYDKSITHSIFLNEKSTIIYKARRFICPICGTTFYEESPFTDEYSFTSSKTVDNVLELLKHYNETFSSVARKVNLSPNQVMKIFDEHVQLPRNIFTQSICFDEIYFSRKARCKYAFVILSFTKGHVLDILHTREKHYLISYFRKIPIEERKIVQYISIDMNPIYKEVISICFPWATVCVDSFHVMRCLSHSLDLVRLRVMRKFAINKRSDQYYLLKYQKHLLFTEIKDDSYNKTKKNHHFKYFITDKRKLEMMLNIDPELKESFELKEAYHLFNNIDGTLDEKRTQLESLIDRFVSSNIPEMMVMASTLDHWKEEIIHSFILIPKRSKGKDKMVRVSNGPIEGRNKYIKLILQLANGYSNFNRFRNRALFVLNSQSKPSEEKLINTIKLTRKDK